MPERDTLLHHHRASWRGDSSTCMSRRQKQRTEMYSRQGLRGTWLRFIALARNRTPSLPILLHCKSILVNVWSECQFDAKGQRRASSGLLYSFRRALQDIPRLDHRFDSLGDWDQPMSRVHFHVQERIKQKWFDFTVLFFKVSDKCFTPSSPIPFDIRFSVLNVCYDSQADTDQSSNNAQMYLIWVEDCGQMWTSFIAEFVVIQIQRRQCLRGLFPSKWG